MALRRDGSLVAWGATFVPAGVSNVVAISAGWNHALAVLSNGTVQAWQEAGTFYFTPPAGLSNVVATASGSFHALALKKDGTVTGWGQSAHGETNSPAGLSNVMRLAAGEETSLALRNDGTVFAWGRNEAGQTNTPNLTNICAIASGWRFNVALAYKDALEYPVNVAQDLLLIYNASSPDSIFVKDYYLQHRPLVSQANVLGITCHAMETVNRADFTNLIRQPILTWLSANPTKRPPYWILFPDIPSRINELTNRYENPSEPSDHSVSYELWLRVAHTHSCITHINLDGTNACRAYIDKLEYFGNNYSPGKLIISPNRSGYGNTNYYFDGTRADGGGSDTIAAVAREAVLNLGVATNSVVFKKVFPDPGLFGHITNGSNLSGYVCWGYHSTLGPHYAVSNIVTFSGDSEWFVVMTGESVNGIRGYTGEGRFFDWFSENAFGQTAFHATAVGGLSQTSEPLQFGLPSTAILFTDWHRGKRFGNTAWRARQTPYFQVTGDPLITR